MLELRQANGLAGKLRRDAFPTFSPLQKGNLRKVRENEGKYPKDGVEVLLKYK
jgi:hypothetical protein